mgnify:CR=1 FL=1
MAETKEAAEKVATATKKTASKAKSAADTGVYAFTDAGQTAFKEGFERSAAAFGEMSEYSKGNLDAVIASFTAATQGAEKINSSVSAYAKKSMEDGMEAAKSMASVKSIQEAIEMQADFYKSALDSYMAEMAKTADMAAAAMKDAWKPINDRAVVAMDQLQAAGR